MDSWIPCKGSDSLCAKKKKCVCQTFSTYWVFGLTSWFEVMRLEKKRRHRTRISLDRDEVSLGKCSPSVSYIRSAQPRWTERCTLCIHTGTRDHTRSSPHEKSLLLLCALPITHRAHCSLFFLSFLLFLMWVKSLMEWTARGSRGRGCRGGRSKVGGVRWSGWLCGRNRGPEH